MYKNITGYIVAFLLANTLVFSQNTFIPDNNFEQALIDLGLDSPPLDDFVTTSSINGLIELDVSNLDISDLTGIEDFASLEILSCSTNLLTDLNLTENKNLLQLFCHSNDFKELDISQNTLLKNLWCFNNKLTTIDTSKNLELTTLICSENQLTELDVSKNTLLETLIFSYNKLNSIDLSQNLLLDFLTCSYNLIDELNLFENKNLSQLRCENNLLTNLDVSQNEKLIRLHCFSNNLTSIDVSFNIDLNNLYCNDNFLTELNLSNNINLSELLCNNNRLEELNLSNNKELVYIDCHSNLLCNLDLRNDNNLNVVYLDAKKNSGLACILVDDKIYSNARWGSYKDDFSSYVDNRTECNSVNPLLPLVDSLEDFKGSSYVLPTISNGRYYTESNGNGIELNPGDIIANSQTIYIFNSNNCFSNESSFYINIENEGIKIPNFFTPNNDGKNDLWEIEDIQNKIARISVFDRYGKLIKILSDNDTSWNGILNGTFLPSDTYWYIIELKNKSTIKGYFALVR